MTNYRVVTSFSDKIWRAYGKKTIASVYDHLPKDVDFLVYYNGAFEPAWEERMPNAKFIDMNKRADYQYYRQKYKLKTAPEGVPQGHLFRFNHLPFWNKVFAIRDAALHTSCETRLIWMDADLISPKEISKEDLDRWTDGADISTLVRTAPWNTWETGFIGFNFSRQNYSKVFSFIEDVYNTYLDGTIFDFNEWHDAYLFTVLFKKYRRKLTLKNLNMMMSSPHPFDTSVLPPQLFHMKGPRKVEGRLWDPSVANGVFKADFTGAINVKDEEIPRLTGAGNIIYKGEFR